MMLLINVPYACKKSNVLNFNQLPIRQQTNKHSIALYLFFKNDALKIFNIIILEKRKQNSKALKLSTTVVCCFLHCSKLNLNYLRNCFVFYYLFCKLKKNSMNKKIFARKFCETNFCAQFDDMCFYLFLSKLKVACFQLDSIQIIPFFTLFIQQIKLQHIKLNYLLNYLL